jgi:DNA-binding PadR family transcriptional regulator
MTKVPPQLSRAQLFILCALLADAKHGYAIMQDVHDISEGTYDIGPATLYENLNRLLELSFISETRGPASEDPRRRYYRLTAAGKRIVTEELARLDRLVARVSVRPLKPGEELA